MVKVLILLFVVCYSGHFEVSTACQMIKLRSPSGRPLWRRWCKSELTWEQQQSTTTTRPINSCKPPMKGKTCSELQCGGAAYCFRRKAIVYYGFNKTVGEWGDTKKSCEDKLLDVARVMDEDTHDLIMQNIKKFYKVGGSPTEFILWIALEKMAKKGNCELIGPTHHSVVEADCSVTSGRKYTPMCQKYYPNLTN